MIIICDIKGRIDNRNKMEDKSSHSRHGTLLTFFGHVIAGLVSPLRNDHLGVGW